MCSSSLDAATFSNGISHIAVGSESGVVSIYQYNNNNVKPVLIKSVMNLTTKVSCTKFHPSGQMLAVASNEVSFCLFYDIRICISIVVLLFFKRHYTI